MNISPLSLISACWPAHLSSLPSSHSPSWAGPVRAVLLPPRQPSSTPAQVARTPAATAAPPFPPSATDARARTSVPPPSSRNRSARQPQPPPVPTSRVVGSPSPRPGLFLSEAEPRPPPRVSLSRSPLHFRLVSATTTAQRSSEDCRPPSASPSSPSHRRLHPSPL